MSWLGYAFRFMQLPLGLFGVAIASATLPSISRSAGAGRFRRVPPHALQIAGHGVSADAAVLGRTDRAGQVPSSARFTRAANSARIDTQQTALALSCYAIGLAGYAALKVLNPAFYALHDARTPMIVSLLSIAVNYVTASLLLRDSSLGHAGLRSPPRRWRCSESWRCS